MAGILETWVNTSIGYTIDPLIDFSGPGRPDPTAASTAMGLSRMHQPNTDFPIDQIPASLTAGAMRYGLLWTDVLPLAEIDDYGLPGFTAAEGLCASTDFPSIVVGRQFIQTNGSTLTHAVRWTAEVDGNGNVNVVPLDLGTLGGASSEAWGVNTAGAIVGISLDGQARRRAFLWTAGGTAGPQSNPQMADLGTLGGAEARAYQINDSGQVCGWAQAGDGSVHAFVFLPAAAYGLPAGFNALDLAGYQSGMAFAIDNQGRVVGALDTRSSPPPGGLGRDAPSGASTAVLWDLSAGTTTLLSPLSAGTGVTPGAPTFATALGMVDLAGGAAPVLTIVGSSGQATAGVVPHAVSWDATGVVSDLNRHLDANHDQWTLTEATGISQAGWICGNGTALNRTYGDMSATIGAYGWIAEPHVHVTYGGLLNSLLTAWVVGVWSDSRFDGPGGRPTIGTVLRPPLPDPVGPQLQVTVPASGELDELLGALAIARLAEHLPNRHARRTLRTQALAGIRRADTEAVAAILARLEQPVTG